MQSYTPIRIVDERSIARRRKDRNGKTLGGVVRISRNRARACPGRIRACLSARVKAWQASTVKMSGESNSWTDLPRSSRSLSALSESGSVSTHLTITDESMTYFMGAGREAREWRERRCPQDRAFGRPLPGSGGYAPEPGVQCRDRR